MSASLSSARPAALHNLESLRSPDPGMEIFIGNVGALSSRYVIEFSAILGAAEQERAEQFVFERDRHRFRATRILLRQLLAAVFDQSPSDLVFRYGRRGKPYLVGDHEDGRGLCFNLSHSGDFAVFALAWNRELGIDLEAIAPSPARSAELNTLAPRMFSHRELAIWRELSDWPRQQEAFFRAWVRKEALLKATGHGLAAPLQEIEVLSGVEEGEPTWNTQIDPWEVHELSAPRGFVAALACKQLRPSSSCGATKLFFR